MKNYLFRIHGKRAEPTVLLLWVCYAAASFGTSVASNRALKTSVFLRFSGATWNFFPFDVYILVESQVGEFRQLD